MGDLSWGLINNWAKPMSQRWQATQTGNQNMFKTFSVWTLTKLQISLKQIMVDHKQERKSNNNEFKWNIWNATIVWSLHGESMIKYTFHDPYQKNCKIVIN
jgi:hypothetical protein